MRTVTGKRALGKFPTAEQEKPCQPNFRREIFSQDAEIGLHVSCGQGSQNLPNRCTGGQQLFCQCRNRL